MVCRAHDDTSVCVFQKISAVIIKAVKYDMFAADLCTPLAEVPGYFTRKSEVTRDSASASRGDGHAQLIASSFTPSGSGLLCPLFPSHV